MWIDLSVSPISLKVLLNGGSYVQVGTYNVGDGATYQPETGLFDRAGQWNYVKIVIDFYNKVYKSLQFNETFFDLTNPAVLSSNAIDTTADTGVRTMHFSTEFAQTNSIPTERFINIAQPVATFE